MALFASTKAKGGMLTSYKPSLSMHPLNEDSTAEEYTPVYFTVTVHHLKMVEVKTLNHPQQQPHIRPLWLSKEYSSQIFQISCEVDTGASCNILPMYKAKAFLQHLNTQQPTIRFTMNP